MGDKADKREKESKLLDLDRKEIQKARRAGRKSVMLHGKKFSIIRQVRNVTTKIGGESKRFREVWLVARRADGTLLPVLSVEERPGENVRSK